MKINEIKKDLFTMPENYVLAHCISADAKMGAGIAVEFKRKFNLSSLQIMASKGELQIGNCYKLDRIMNLVTKSKYWNKPTYESITASIRVMREMCEQEEITQLAMPEIGCGLDKLQWSKVKEILINEFQDSGVEITVCRL